MLQQQRAAVLRDLLIAVNDGRITEAEANQVYTHEVWTRVARALGLEYRREP